ncbi:MAG TPA: hypothetical protein VLN45_12290, partial [Ignavibacteriaceae bacterium]|nr:hypothetical protein [Ignavibacteriaceae bacterium]
TVVIFEKDLLRRNNLETASVSVFLFLLYISPFVFLLLFFLIIRGSSKNWVWPISANENIYKKLLLCFIFTSIVLLFIFFFSNDQAITFIATFIFPHSALILTGVMIVLKLQKSSTQNFTVERSKREWQFASLIILLDALAVILFIISIKSFSLINLFVLLFIWLASTFTCLLFLLEIPSSTEQMLQNRVKPVFNLISKMKDFLRDKESLRQSTRWYGFAITGFLILGSVIPAIGFFGITYQTQIKLYIKQAQVDYFDKLEEREKQIDNYYKRDIFTNSDELKEKRLDETMDIYSGCFYQTKKDSTKKYPGKVLASTWFDTQIVHELIPQFGEAGLKPKVLTFNSADNFFSWYKFEDGSNSQLILETKNTSGKDSLIYVSNLPQLNNIFKGRNLGFWLFIIVVITGGIIIFYFLIHYVMKNAFLVNADTLSYQKNYKLFTDKLQKHVLVLSNNSTLAGEIKEKINGSVIELPEIIKEHFDPETKKTKWILQPEINPDLKDTNLVLNGFEFGFSNYQVNLLKLNLLEELIYTRKNRVVIISSVHPLGGFVCSEPEAPREFKQNILNRWKDIFAGIISTSLHTSSEEMGNLVTEYRFNKTSPSFMEFIKFILFPSPSLDIFLTQELVNKKIKMFHPEIFEAGQEIKLIAQEKNLNFSNVFDLAMDRTRSYNRFLWDSCSIDEKLVLIRLAKDRFVHISNLATVENLLRRGILKRDPNLKPFNTFFTHFVLEANLPEEKYWDEQNSQSGWNKFRTPILIVLVGIMIFLFSTQTEIYTNTLAIITSASILIPAVLRLLGIFQSKQTVSKTSD